MATWIGRAANAYTDTTAAGDDQYQGPPPLDAHACSFGRWYSGPGRHRYGHLPAYRAIAPAHDELHAIAERLVAALREGRNDEARSWLGPLGIAGEALRNQLRALIAELSGSEP